MNFLLFSNQVLALGSKQIIWRRNVIDKFVWLNNLLNL